MPITSQSTRSIVLLISDLALRLYEDTVVGKRHAFVPSPVLDGSNRSFERQIYPHGRGAGGHHFL
jgi:hypothetical protein